MTRFIPAACLVLTLLTGAVAAHDGPPFPILSSHHAGAYVISIWTDPDTTDDGTPGGQFWVRVHTPGNDVVSADTRATVSIAPRDRTGAELTAAAEPVRGDPSNQFAALVMDHEGAYTVRVVVDGPLGRASAEATVDATYDTRPAPYLLVVYLLPFVFVGVVWVRLIAKRRRAN
jgi:hypothetical protein